MSKATTSTSAIPVTNAKTSSKKGNKNTEVIVGSAAIKLEAAVKSLLGAVQEVSSLDDKAAECTLKVSDLQDQIGGLQNQLANQKAQNEFELDLQYKADKRLFSEIWLNENNMTSIPSSDLQDLKNRLSKATMEVSQAVNSAVGAATTNLNNKHESELKMKDLEYKTSEATNLATISQLKAEVAIWKEQATSWQKALDSERSAGVERSKAGAIGTLNLGGNGK